MCWVIVGVLFVYIKLTSSSFESFSGLIVVGVGVIVGVIVGVFKALVYLFSDWKICTVIECRLI
jgi:hypothetical protein